MAPVGLAAEQAFGHHRAAAVGGADEEDVHAVSSAVAASGVSSAGRGCSPRTNWYASPPSEAPTTGARTYTQSACRLPETRAGPSERIGFIEAPLIGPPNIASRPIVPPIAIAAASPTARVSVATARITNIRNALITSSHRNDCPCDPEGSVAPTWAILPSEPRRSAAAATAAVSCTAQYASARRHGK